MAALTIEGTIQRKGMGSGTWALVGNDGTTYEIYQGKPKELLKTGLQVRVQGQVRQDVMTLAMIGPVLEVTGFETMG